MYITTFIIPELGGPIPYTHAIINNNNNNTNRSTKLKLFIRVQYYNIIISECL